MKKRKCFVSNSSSASFIVEWSCGEMSKEDALQSVFDLYTDKKTGKLKQEDPIIADIYKYVVELYHYLLKNTKVKNGHFETKFYTVMFNSYSDIPTAAKPLLIYLAIGDDNSKLISARIEHE